MRDDVKEANLPEWRDEEAHLSPVSPMSVEQFDGAMSPPSGLGSRARRGEPSVSCRHSPPASAHDILWRCRTRQNLTGTSLPQIRRCLAHAWRSMLVLQTDEALGTLEQVELQLADVSLLAARRISAATELLRAVCLAFQDDTLAALTVASARLRESPAGQDSYVAATLCRLGFWRLGKLDDFHSLPRHQPHARRSKPRAMSAMLDLSIEAAVALDQLRISAAKRLASDALTVAERADVGAGLAALPACLVAEVLYEEGCLDEADRMLRDRLPAINAQGSIECALRAYLVLARIARYRAQPDLAAILLREAVVLGERRGWSRLVAACIAERASLLAAAGWIKEARLSVEFLDRYAEAHRPASGHPFSEMTRYRMLARWRISWAEARSPEAVAVLRQLYHQAIERRDLYAGCRLAVELAEMLASIGESEEAEALFFNTVRVGAAAGLCQVFLEGGAGLAALLRRAYQLAEEPGSTDRDVLAFVGSLLSRFDARGIEGSSSRPNGRISSTLTARECDILALISQGWPNKRIARALEISPETVKSHIKGTFLKLASSTRAEAVYRAKSLGLL